ncbi:glycosyl hydrolase 115 family protein [uncultured Muribaculum sp.]|nr:glycosyl hydrolase 115 family protein [uncultured Muribaculum sp.]
MKQFHCLLTLLLLCISHTATATGICWYDGSGPVKLYVPEKASMVVKVASQMFSDDMLAVTGRKSITVPEKNATIVLTQLDRASAAQRRQLSAKGIDIKKLESLTDGFSIITDNKKIYVTGTNGRGTAYGLLELSRQAGVSPWVWWGDVVPQPQNRLAIPHGYATMQGASVEYRGIFLNDEDWSLRPWSYRNYDKSDFGNIGARTYKRIFELLLRLRANAIWPGMHTGTKAFFRTEGAKAIADSCGIVIGTSHCEPLLRNNVNEWNHKERGAFNYITNKDAVQKYWIERLKEVKDSEGGNMFTIGMRGIHDGSMEGVRTMDEKHNALQQVINDQQALIGKYIGKPEQQMQVFVPYKEVLEIYERGLKVPEYATLMWCDDNYGYITRLSNADEQKRKGGGGVYYHLSYWGRPHDYLWLTTTQPGLIYNEMRQAYNHNVRKLWIVNVHDPKVAGYDLELFLDMAWNIDCVNGSTIGSHYNNWLCRQFGNEAGNAVFNGMKEFYRLCGQRRPEFMGWSQVELDKKLYQRGLSPVIDTEFSLTEFGNELDRYLYRYNTVCNAVAEAEKLIRPELKDAYFAAIKYPVFAAAAQARKTLEAQRARSFAKGSTNKDMFTGNPSLYAACAKSQQAYQEIRSLTNYYNKTMSDGKWDGIMHMRPRDLPVYAAPSLPTLLTDTEIDEWLAKGKKTNSVRPLSHNDIIAVNACRYTSASPGTETIDMLGHSMKAVSLQKEGSLTYEFSTETEGDATLYTALIPTQPNDGGDLRYAVSIDGGDETVISLKEPFRSERWKKNVLRGQSLRTTPIHISKGRHTLTIRALDQHIVVDQWMIDFKPGRKFYLIPTE